VGRVNVENRRFLTASPRTTKPWFPTFPGTTPRPRLRLRYLARPDVFGRRHRRGERAGTRTARTGGAAIQIALEEAMHCLYRRRPKRHFRRGRALAKRLREGDKPVFIVVNKCDNPALRNEAEAELAPAGFEEIFPFPLNGTGVGEVLEAAFKRSQLKLKMPEAVEEPATKITVIGSPTSASRQSSTPSWRRTRCCFRIRRHTREPIDTFLYDKHRFCW